MTGQKEEGDDDADRAIAVQDPKGGKGTGLMTEGTEVVVNNGRQRCFFFP